LYDSVADTVKRVITNSESMQIKVDAIHALGLLTYFGGAGEEEALDVLAFLLEIIESDGHSVEAHDEGTVVVAALQQWGFLATEMDDLEDATQEAIECFIEQLESADPEVQIAAGENIALLYEKSYTPLEDGEEMPDSDDDDDAPRTGEKLVQRYTVYNRQDQLIHILNSLANVSSRRISKKDRRNLHSSFADIRNTVEKPTRGPGYSTALDQETGLAYGAGRIKVKVNASLELRIDKWYKLLRLNALRRALQGGFVHHYEDNDAVGRCLPFSVAGRK
jgi:hypothetical protein